MNCCTNWTRPPLSHCIVLSRRYIVDSHILLVYVSVCPSSSLGTFLYLSSKMCNGTATDRETDFKYNRHHPISHSLLFLLLLQPLLRMIQIDTQTKFHHVAKNDIHEIIIHNCNNFSIQHKKWTIFISIQRYTRIVIDAGTETEREVWKERRKRFVCNGIEYIMQYRLYRHSSMPLYVPC